MVSGVLACKSKKERLRPLFLMDKLMLIAPHHFAVRQAFPKSGIPPSDIFGCTGLIGQDVDTFAGPVLARP
jgi:hypothetical protein